MAVIAKTSTHYVFPLNYNTKISLRSKSICKKSLVKVRPDIERGGVVGGAEEDVRRPVPEGDDLVGVRVRRNGFGASETCKKITKKFIFCYFKFFLI